MLADAWTLAGAACVAFFLIGLLDRGSGPSRPGVMTVTGITSAVFIVWLMRYGGQHF